ncbi:MAG: 50S ribosomal protein L9 [Anaerolineales bacterium]
MKVILTDYVYKHGVAGDVVSVADGFARNFLIPRGLAVKATEYNLKHNESLMAQAAVHRNELNERLVAVANEIEGTELVFGRKAGSNGKLYGSVTTMDIADALLEKTGIDINRRRISERPLREIGSFEVPIRMGQDLSPSVHITIVREEDLAAYLAEREVPDEVAEILDDADEVFMGREDTMVALDDADALEAAVEESEDLEATPSAVAEEPDESEEPETNA